MELAEQSQTLDGTVLEEDVTIQIESFNDYSI